MPTAHPWSDADDRRLRDLLGQPGATLRKIAPMFEVSRSFIQRRVVILSRKVEPDRVCAPEREGAGIWPLAAGHPISWGAIALPLHA